MNVLDTFIDLTKKIHIYSSEDQMKVFLTEGIREDEAGNYYLQIGHSQSMFTAHLDTVAGNDSQEVTHFIAMSLRADDIDIDIDQLKELLDEVGISLASDNLYSLILHNDSVHDMLFVVLQLYEICGLNNEDALRVMMEAHTKGKALVKSGSYEDMYALKCGLNQKGLEATLE